MDFRKETAVDKYSAASGLASAIGVTAAQAGIDILPICNALNLDPTTFADITGRISLDRLCRLLETCAVLSGDEAFGLRSVDNFKAGSTGPFGYGLLTAPKAIDFFHFLGDHQQFVSETSYSKLTINSAGAELVWTFSPLIIHREQFVDMGFGLIFARFRDAFGNASNSVEASMERPKPKNGAVFRDRISRKVTFGAHINRIQLPIECLSLVNPAGNAELFKLMDLQCRQMRPEPKEYQEFTTELREYILRHISDNTVSLADAADYFRVSDRTLQRRLSESGTTLNDVRDDVRRDLAARLLGESDLSASEISVRLGYSASSAFTRSTLRWFGRTPRDFRKFAIAEGSR
jgi:AraC-like DNA-binding protein